MTGFTSFGGRFFLMKSAGASKPILAYPRAAHKAGEMFQPG